MTSAATVTCLCLPGFTGRTCDLGECYTLDLYLLQSAGDKLFLVPIVASLQDELNSYISFKILCAIRDGRDITTVIGMQ